MTSSWKRSLGALALLLCFGLSVPAAGGSLHICLSEWVQSFSDQPSCCCDCCSHCNKAPQHGSPCCVELEELPDAQPPASAFSLPDVPVSDFKRLISIPPRAEAQLIHLPAPPAMIRGPGSPGSLRAILEIWRL